MNRYRASFGILTAVILAGSAPALTHEECDDVPQAKSASAERGDSTGPQSKAGSSVTVKLFQYQPGRIQVKAGTTVTWINEDEI